MYLAWHFNNTELLKQFAPRFNNVVAHHCTIAFGHKAISQYFDMHPNVKRKAELVVDFDVSNSRVQAVGIRDFAGLSMNGFPHITISHIDGAKPVESNELVHCCGFDVKDGLVLKAEMKLFG